MRFYIACFLLFCSAVICFAGNEEIVISEGESRTVTFPDKLKKVAVGNPEIADVKTVSAYEILVNGKMEGYTSLIIWQQECWRLHDHPRQWLPSVNGDQLPR